jgi:FMN phosphatase YigB (HAD superfamily)
MDSQPATQNRLRTLTPEKTQLKALIFDVGDILYDASVWRKWLTGELVELGKPVTYDGLVAAWETLLVDVYKGQADYWKKFVELMQQFGLQPDEITAIQASAKDKGQAVVADRCPMPGVPETLSKLHAQGIKLVALSDTESGEAGIRKTLKQLNIEQYFHAVVSSSAIGHVKPEPQAFDYAIQATGCTKCECGFVAHDIDELAGAQQHDLRAIGYNYHPDAPADTYIEHFSELLKVVGE